MSRSRRRSRRRGRKTLATPSSRPLRTRRVSFGWADVPAPLSMCDFDRDTETEETGPEPVRSVREGRESWWDLDDWGDEE